MHPTIPETHCVAYAVIMLVLCLGFCAIGYFYGYEHGKRVK